MIRKNFFFLAIFLSILVHLSAFYNLKKKSTKEKHIVVIDLSTYKEFSKPEDTKKIETKKITKKKVEKIPEKKVEKIEKKPPLLKKTIPTKKKVEIKKEVKKTIEEPKKEVETIIPKQTSSKTSIKKDRVLIDKELSNFLRLISNQINHIAAKSYPLQSIKRREQGTVIALITLSQNGNLKILEIEKKRPKRLVKATQTILKNYKFPQPPKMILDENNEVKIKIPVNFILRN